MVCRWVYKTKLRPDGKIDRFKSRLATKGYNQIEGIDFRDSFSPVAKVVTIRIIFAIVSANYSPLYHLDINNAFLHGKLDEEVYMLPPDGYKRYGQGEVCKLKNLCTG